MHFAKRTIDVGPVSRGVPVSTIPACTQAHTTLTELC